MLQKYITSSDGFIEPLKVANYFHTTIEEVSVFTGVALSTLKKSKRSHTPKAQSKLQAVTEIISKLTVWTNSEQLAYAWYRNEPVPAFGGLTTENVVIQGNIAKARKYIEHLALGGFA
jgi:hypothetical protein